MIFHGCETYVSEEPAASIFRLADFLHIDELIWTVLRICVTVMTYVNILN